MSGGAATGEFGWGRFDSGSVERRMLLDVGRVLGVVLRPRTIVLERARVEVEGMDQDGRFVVQLVANQGAYKPAFRNKVMADMFKLLWLRRAVPGAPTAVVVVAEPVVRALAGWVAVAAAELGVEVLVWNDGRVQAHSAEEA